MLAAPLAPLAAYRQFITYRLTPGEGGKTDKTPLDWRTGRGASPTDPASHGTYDEAAAAVTAGRGHGVGFVFTDADPFWFLDIDHALGPDGWSPVAAELYHALAGAACEVSQSGRGLHIIGSGAVPEHRCRGALDLEFYHTGRFVALTNNCYPGGSAATDLTMQISMLIPRYFAPSMTAGARASEWTREPVAEWAGPIDDDELVRMARASRSASAAFGGGVTFSDLWDANAPALAARWPGQTDGYDASAADAALASHLAFWTGKDCERVERLMRASALVREKWDRAGGYLEPTILGACATVRSVCVLEKSMLIAPEAGVYVGPAAFPAYFEGCTYVVAEDRIYTPNGDLLKASQFDTLYGGKSFILDGEGRKTTTSAWEAFRLNQQWRCPVADRLCFRPERPPASIVEDEGLRLLNTYVPIAVRRVAGDPSPFVDHLRRMYPNERDFQILTSYMAALVQNPGRKFQWWPVLQGVKGNGKTLLLRAVSHAIGHRYTHLVNPEAMAKTGNQFNSWVQGNLFLGFEEVKVRGCRDFYDSIKTTVTNDRIALEGKGANQGTGDNRANGMICLNAKEAAPIHDDERRYAILWGAQQHACDLARDGMDGDYFPNLYDWMHGRGKHAYSGVDHGFAVVADYLATLTPVAEFNPAGLCQRGPRTSSTADAVRASLGLAEQEILEAVGEGRPGFAGGWVSSHYLDELLERRRIAVPRNQRRGMMAALGYDTHPAFVSTEGRVHNTVAPDNRKPTLYLRAGHLALNLAKPVEIARAYTLAQSAVVDAFDNKHALC